MKGDSITLFSPHEVPELVESFGLPEFDELYLKAEKNTNIKIGNSYLVWINESNTNYRIFTCKDLTAEIKLMLEKFDK